MAAQSVDFLAALIPHLRAQIAQVLPPSRHPLLDELERVAADLGEHRYCKHLSDSSGEVETHTGGFGLIGRHC